MFVSAGFREKRLALRAGLEVKAYEKMTDADKNFWIIEVWLWI